MNLEPIYTEWSKSEWGRQILYINADMWNLSSPTRDGTQTPCIGSTDPYPEPPGKSFVLYVKVTFFQPVTTCLWYLWRRKWQPTPVLLPGKSHGWRSLVGCSPWGRKESDTTEWLHFPFSLSCIGEGNGNPLQCSCLENPRDGGAWWAAVCGVTQSRTRLMRLSSSMVSFVVKFLFSFVFSRISVLGRNFFPDPKL